MNTKTQIDWKTDRKAYMRARYIKNKEKMNVQSREYYNTHKDHLVARQKERYAIVDGIKERKKEYQKKYAQENKDKVKRHHKKYQTSDHGQQTIREHLKRWWPTRPVKSRIAASLRGCMRNAIYQQLASKHAKSEMYIGCTWDELMKHLESKFQYGMSWDNYGFGKDKWNIDHIIPCASFDLLKTEEQYKCFHYTNLQPLWQNENLAKSDKLDWMPD